MAQLQKLCREYKVLLKSKVAAKLIFKQRLGVNNPGYKHRTCCHKSTSLQNSKSSGGVHKEACFHFLLTVCLLLLHILLCFEHSDWSEPKIIYSGFVF